jgi:chromosome partitioning protein
MQTTVVMNAKGGVGKTTIATNLASYFVANAVPTTIMDYDPQGSSLRWLKLRPPTAAPIHGANAAPRTGTALKSLERFVPPTTKQLILDAPAGPSRLLLKDLLDKAGSILIPVAPSAIDIHATANFIKDLLLVGGVRHRNIRIAVIANRVRSSDVVYEPLERFVSSLRLTFLSRRWIRRVVRGGRDSSSVAPLVAVLLLVQPARAADSAETPGKLVQALARACWSA